MLGEAHGDAICFVPATNVYVQLVRTQMTSTASDCAFRNPTLSTRSIWLYHRIYGFHITAVQQTIPPVVDRKAHSPRTHGVLPVRHWLVELFTLCLPVLSTRMLRRTMSQSVSDLHGSRWPDRPGVSGFTAFRT